MRYGYDQPHGDLAGLGAYVEYIFKSDYTIDNANYTTIPSYSVVNLNAHYNHDLTNFYIKNIELFFDVQNVFNRTYVAGAQMLGNTLITGTPISNADRLADRRPGAGARRGHHRRPTARFQRRRQTQVLTRSRAAPSLGRRPPDERLYSEASRTLSARHPL